MAAYFACLDTNILFDLVQEIAAGKTPRGWPELRKLVETDDVKLLVPEITLLELESCIGDADNGLRVETAKVEGSTNDKVLRQHLTKSLPEWRNKTVQAWRTEGQKLEIWLRARHVIEYNESLGHRTKRRLIAGKFPRPPKDDPNARSPQAKWLRDQDCAIIESLKSYFDEEFGGKFNGEQLVFGTRDSEKKDGGFGPCDPKGVGTLDKTFQDGLPLTQTFRDLPKLAEFVKEKKTVTLPTEEEVEQEKKREVEGRAEVAGGKTLVAVNTGGGTTVEILVGNTHDVANVFPPPIDNSLEGSPGHQMGNDRMWRERRRLGGVTMGPYVVAEQETEPTKPPESVKKQKPRKK